MFIKFIVLKILFYLRSKIYFVNNHYYLKYANDINMGDIY